MKTVTDNDDIILITSDGVIIRMHTDEISSYSRQTQGVRVMRLDDGVSVMSIARTEREEETDEEAENSEEVIADDTTETQIADASTITIDRIIAITLIDFFIITRHLLLFRFRQQFEFRLYHQQR